MRMVPTVDSARHEGSGVLPGCEFAMQQNVVQLHGAGA